MDFKNSETKLNLMRAFAGESQARNRYTMAAKKARDQKLYVIQTVFELTADQEKAHAKVFYEILKDFEGETITIDGGYPVNTSNSIPQLLRYAEHNENEEYETVYKSFGDTAKNEGFTEAAGKFYEIAEIENIHRERFKIFADFMEENKLFVSEAECGWVCLNCGFKVNAKGAPNVCPVCGEEKGFFVRATLAPFMK